jgi:putative ABC transport system permease protein
MESTFQDLRFALRALSKTPGFTIAAVLTLALGIGAMTAMFTVVNAAFLCPLPFHASDRLVWATEFYPKFNQSLLFVPEYLAWRHNNASFERLEATGMTSGVNLSAANYAPQRVQASHVTPGFFTMLGAHPKLGRSFLSDEDQPGRSGVAVVSDALWRNYFDADAHVLGKEIRINGKSAKVIGVMPRGFLDPNGADTDIWMPDAIDPAHTAPARGMSLVSVIGRLQPGMSAQQAAANLNTIARSMDGQYPQPWSSYHAAAKARVVSLQNRLASSSQTALWVLMGVVAFILVIVCANVASLFLARAVARDKEIAIRAAIGASRSRLVRLLLTESTLLGGLGAVLGFIIASFASSAFRFLLPDVLQGQVAIDWRVLAFGVLCTALTVVLFGLAPAITASKLDLSSSLKDAGPFQGSRWRSWNARSVLAVAQLALSVVLLVGAGLLIRTFVFLLGVNPGFDPHNVLLGDVSLAPLELYSQPRQIDFFDRLLSKAEKLPGVEFAGLSSSTPLLPFNEIGRGLQPEGGPPSNETVVMTSTSADYFRALRIPLLAGRFFSDRDRTGTPPVAIINHSLAKALFEDRDPVGHRIKTGDESDAWVTVVGVVADIRHRSLDSRIWAELFRPYTQAPSFWMGVVIRTSGDPLTLAPAVRKAVQSIDRNQPVFNVESLDQRMSSSLGERRRRAYLLGAFAFVALLIALIGVYGVMAYSVTRRTREIGVRLALGAQRQAVLRMILGQAVRMALTGVAWGLIAAVALTRVLSSFLYGVTATDIPTFAAVCGLLIAAVCLASLVPARRAAKVDPIVALRHE